MNVTTAQLRSRGIDPLTGRKLAPSPARRPRGTGDYAIAKAAKTARHPLVLELLGVDALPDGVEVVAEGTPNAWEAEYLAIMRTLGPAMFEPISLRLADGCIYTPDIVARFDGELYCVEVKGHLRDAARVRYLVARDKYPQFSFSMMRKVGGRWESVKLKGIKA